MTAKKTAKIPMSVRVPEDVKGTLEKEAEEAGLTLSEHVVSVLAEWKKKEEQFHLEREELKRQVEAKDTLIERLTDSLEREQKLVGQQQELQLRAQVQFERVQKEHQLLLESTEQKRSWWKIWSK